MLENRKKYPLNFLLQVPIFLQPELPHAFKKKKKKTNPTSLQGTSYHSTYETCETFYGSKKNNFKMCYSVLMDFCVLIAAIVVTLLVIPSLPNTQVTQVECKNGPGGGDHNGNGNFFSTF